MKSFSAIGLAFVPEFLRRGLRKPLHFALSYDEEVGCIGVRRLIADIVARGVRPAGCIVGEPTGMELVVAHKGKTSWRCRVRGSRGAFVADAARRQRGADRVRDRRVHRAARARLPRRRPARRRATTSRTRPCTSASIRGGTALNIVPRDCAFDFEIRHLPFDDPEAFFADVRAFAARFVPDDARGRRRRPCIEFDHAVDAARVRHARRQRDHRRSATRATATTSVGKVSFGTEASLFHGAGIPTIICGPGHIAQAHQPNEWVALEQLARCEAFMRRLADRVCVELTRAWTRHASSARRCAPPIEVAFPDLDAWQPATPAFPTSGASRRSAPGRT